MGYTHHKVAENRFTTVYERTDQGLFGLGILANADKDYVAVDNQTVAAVSGTTVAEARARLEQLEGKTVGPLVGPASFDLHPSLT